MTAERLERHFDASHHKQSLPQHIYHEIEESFKHLLRKAQEGHGHGAHDQRHSLDLNTHHLYGHGHSAHHLMAANELSHQHSIKHTHDRHETSPSHTHDRHESSPRIGHAPDKFLEPFSYSQPQSFAPEPAVRADSSIGADTAWAQTTKPTELITGGSSSAHLNEKTAPPSASSDSTSSGSGAFHPPAIAGDPIPDSIKSAELPQIANQVFSRVDRDGNSYMSRQELATALQEGGFNEKEKQAVAALYENYDDIRNLTHESWFGSPKGISKGDITEFDTREKKQQELETKTREIDKWVSNPENLKKIEATSGHGLITKAGLDQALAQPNLAEADRQAIKYLRENYSAIDKTHSGMTLNDIYKHCSEKSNNTTQAKLDCNIDFYAKRTAQAEMQTKELYADRVNNLNSITPDAVRQGSIGNCYYEATVAGIAASNPQAIKNMIKDNGNGTCTVTFPGDKAHPVTVNTPTAAEIGVYNGASDKGTWACVLEKAYGQYCNEHSEYRNTSSARTPTEGADGGGYSDHTMRLLTGNNTDSDTLLFTRQSVVRQKLMDAFSSDKKCAVTASTSDSFFSSRTADGFVRNHCHTVTNFDPNGADGGTVTIRNPWGNGKGIEGTSDISLKQFMHNFEDIVRETR